LICKNHEIAEDAFAHMFRIVNNAGVSFEARHPAVLHLTDEETWDRTMDINAKSVFLGCKYAINQMLKQDLHPSGDRGWIINMSSIMGMIAGPENRKPSCFNYLIILKSNSASYCASKGAVSSLTRQVALDYAKHKIHVNALCPGCKPSTSWQRSWRPMC
jgi:NAD(P)-dependent dehydrogenase (short-subunit alcohol dehydrogenase family)